MLSEATVKRLGIFFFYDKDGIVDDYVLYLLDDLVKSLERIIIVCNGLLNKEGREKFKKYTDEVFVRENKGFDVWAYKTALEYVGWDKLAEYDEAVLLNSTIMGPVYPFSEMFAEMDRRDVDFWGITKYGKEEIDPFGCNPYNYVPEHIQSHFMVFRQSFLKSIELKMYWDEMPEIDSYIKSVGYHESAFTKRFEDKGFTWDVYVDTDEYKGLTTYPLIFYPKDLIVNHRCPIFKRRGFFQDYDYVVTNTVGQGSMELYKYLCESGIYDVRMIWQNILRTCSQADIARNLHLNYVLPTRNEPEPLLEKIAAESKVALVMHLYFPDLLEDSLGWASAMPENTDVYITTNTEEKKKEIEAVFSALKCRKLDVRVIENRGRDVSSLLVGVRDVVMDYDYVCFVHDKKTAQVKPGSVGEGFAYKCFRNTLYNRRYVLEMIRLFKENPRLGIASPPAPNHGDFFPGLGYEWTHNYEATKKLADELKIKVILDPEKEHLAPLGTMFWFRPEAMRPLFAKEWKYEDFPKEPNKVDGTLLHAVERLYPFAVQEAGYYPAFVMADEYARIEITNLYYYTRNYNRILEKYGIMNYAFKMREDLEHILAGDVDTPMVQMRAHIFELEAQLADMYKKTSLKYQLKDRFLRLFGLRK